MNSTDLVLQLISHFEQLKIPYMLVGSFSSNLYGRPRMTHDADFVVQIDSAQVSLLKHALGPEFRVDPQMSFETITMTTRYVIEHPTTAFKIEIFLLSNDAHDQIRFKRRQLVDFEGHMTWLPTPEDVVVTKLRWSKGGRRQKDVDDVAQIFKVRAKQLDHSYIHRWCDQHGTRDLFEKLLLECQQFEQEHP